MVSNTEFKAALGAMNEGFSETEENIINIVIGTAFDAKLPQDLRLEIITRALHFYKLQTAFSTVGFLAGIMEKDNVGALDREALLREVVKAARQIQQIGAQMDRAAELLSASIETAGLLLNTTSEDAK